MRTVAVLLSTLLLVACSATGPAASGPSQAQTKPPDAPVEFLLTSATADFLAQRPPTPVHVRNVRSGYVLAPGGTRQYFLCGAFQPASEGGNLRWIPFATIKTSGYEQWQGAQAERFCASPTVVWVGEDLSSALQSRLDEAGKR